MKVLLCGYHKICEQILLILMSRTDINDIAVCTHKPHMRGIPDMSWFSKGHGIWCSTESVNKVKLPFKPDVIASVYYRNIIKDHIIDMAGGRIFNTHPSLLPRHRGCSSVPWAIIAGDQYTGVTYHYIDDGIDTGNILLQATIKISDEDTQQTLFNKCMSVGTKYWEHAFELVKAGALGVPQEGDSCYHRRGVPYDGKINSSWGEDKIRRFIRAMTYPPQPYAEYEGQEVRTFNDYLLLSRF